MSAMFEERISPLFQWPQTGSYRPMKQDGSQPAGDCVELPEPPQVVLMGSGIIGDAGEWSLDVRSALCIPLYTVDWVSMVATPSLGPNQAFPPGPPPVITTGWKLSGENLELRAYSEPKVPFSWHAVVLHH